MPASLDPRRDFLLGLLGEALAAVNGRQRMRAALAGRSIRDAWVLAAGKAASAMALGALDALGDAVSRLLVVTRADCIDPELTARPGLRVVAAGHPVPDERSLAAGAEALAMAADAAPGQHVLLLVSGGASSLLEAPAQGVTLAALRRFNQWALASGLDIGRINAIRGVLSRVKAGRLLQALAHCEVEGYFISDVPGDDPAVVGSGLLAAGGKGGAVVTDVPDWLRPLIAEGRAPMAITRSVPATCVGSLDDALSAARRAAARAGVGVLAHSRLAGDAVTAAGRICDRLDADPPGLHILGGETTVVLPPDPGRGGRNQHLAVAAAQRMDGRADLVLLACGTDGSDGNTCDAGALVDGGTAGRGRDAGLDPEDCLARADSATFLEAAGDLVHTGPTGTNVGDLLFAWRREPGHSTADRVSM